MLSLIVLSVSAFASGFDWGADCDAGKGDFEQYVPYYETIEVGTIPAGKSDLRVNLEATNDLDIQLIDVETGTEIIGWPNGMLSGPSEDCTNYEGATYCYSGYNGGQTSSTLGREWLEIRGDSNRELVMRAFGYAAGEASVEYKFKPVDTCNEKGDGFFTQYIAQDGVVEVGEIPVGKVNVSVELEAVSGRDVDIQLIGSDGTEIVAWPDGLLNGADAQSVEYGGMTISWSGYNGIDGDWGHESIEISGVLSDTLTLQAYGYQSGDAEVTYEWGIGAGEMCGGIAGFQCEDALMCKQMPSYPDAAGTCHTEQWCGSNETAAEDCANVPHIMVPGAWACETFQCSWSRTTLPNSL